MNSQKLQSSPFVAATWPGAIRGNRFVEILTTGLADAGVELRPVHRPSNVLIPEASALLIQWPDQIFWHANNSIDLARRAVREIWGLWRWRKAGKTLIWIVHNAVPHDRSRTERFIWAAYTRALSSLVHGYMTLSPATRAPVLTSHPSLKEIPYASFRHPSYPDAHRNGPAALAMRNQLGISDNSVLIGAIGMLSAYKGVDELVHVFKQTSDENWRILIAGRPGNKDTITKLESVAGGRADILMDVRHLDDDEFASYVAASDRLVAPYRGYLHSGYLIYTVSAGRMVLTPSTPFSRDLAELVGDGWVNLYEPPLTPEILRAFVERAVPSNPPDISALAPQNAGRDIFSFIVQLRGSRMPMPPAAIHERKSSRAAN